MGINFLFILRLYGQFQNQLLLFQAENFLTKEYPYVTLYMLPLTLIATKQKRQ